MAITLPSPPNSSAPPRSASYKWWVVFMLWFACEYPGALRPGTLLDAVKAIQAKPGASPHHQRRLFFEALNSPQLYPNLD